MSFLCWIGIHRWSFVDRHVIDHDSLVTRILTLARCEREGCTRHPYLTVVNVSRRPW